MSAAPPAAPAPLMVITDLDGTLLDERTYDFTPARPALAALARRGAALVLASSKTRAEMEPLARQLGRTPTLIVENGGAILLPRPEGDFAVVPRGASYRELCAALEAIGEETGTSPLGFSLLSAAAVAGLTGLDLAAAGRAKVREHDEPFLLDDERHAAAVVAAATRRGLRVTRGGRFFHLTGATDKGQAVGDLLARLAGEGQTYHTLGLGDAANDLPLLLAVERPIVMPRPGGALDPTLAAALPDAERAPAPGPEGWNAAVLAVLAGARLPAVAATGSGP